MTTTTFPVEDQSLLWCFDFTRKTHCQTDATRKHNLNFHSCKSTTFIEIYVTDDTRTTNWLNFTWGKAVTSSWIQMFTPVRKRLYRYFNRRSFISPAVAVLLSPLKYNRFYTVVYNLTQVHWFINNLEVSCLRILCLWSTGLHYTISNKLQFDLTCLAVKTHSTLTNN